MPVPRTDRSRFFYPLFLSAGLLALFFFTDGHRGLLPRQLRGVLGADLNVLEFAALIPLFVLIVRFLDVIVFDLFVSRRRKVSVPPLLRDIVSLALYIALFVTALSVLFP